MKIAFFTSSIGDTDLALGTVKSLENKGHEIILISLTKTAQQRMESFHSFSVKQKVTLSEILNLKSESSTEVQCTEEQLQQVADFARSQKINHAYIGVPSTNIHTPFQIAEALEDISVLMAYEFMFKPEEHALWTHLPKLKNMPHIRWAVPLAGALADLDVGDKADIIGQMSIDNAYLPKPSSEKKPADIKESLQITKEQSLTFISSTTQPVKIDATFFDHVLAELPKHPTIQIRFGIHPGIQDLDAYLIQILSIYQKHSDSKQFKIILPDNLVGRIKMPELTITHPQFGSLFLRVNINGSEASSVADRVAQAVPGALPNQSALEGKPIYSHSGKPYLPGQYFSNSISAFFTSSPQPIRAKKDLGLDEKTAPQRCAELILNAPFHHAVVILQKHGAVGQAIIDSMIRLKKGRGSHWNPYWMNSDVKLDRIIQAVEALQTTDSLEVILQDKSSALYLALNMQRLAPITFLGRLSINHSKTLLAVTDELDKKEMGCSL